MITREADLLTTVMPGQENDPLAPSAIAYQERTLSQSTRQELAQRLLTGEQRWLLLLGRTGTGKTREAVEVARLLIRNQWTVLYLTKDYELDAPATPLEALDKRKLLFLLDDLNRRMGSSRFYDAAGAADPDNPLHVPLQARLLRALSRYEQFYGTAKVRVLATARNEEVPASSGEPSEWDKLDMPHYRELWDRFEPLQPLPDPDDEVVRHMLEETSLAANIPVTDAEVLARANDRTFGNIVANLQRARANGTELTPENFQDTLQGTWRERFEDAVRRNPHVREVFGAVLLAARARRSALTVDSVTEMAVRIEPVPSPCARPMPLGRWRARREVRRLTQTAEILNPRDGQIEASGPWDVEPRHVAAAADFVVAFSRRRPEEAGPYLLRVGRSALMLGHFDLAVTIYTRALELNPENAHAWYGRGKAFAGMGDFSRAVRSYRESLDRVSDFFWAWYDLGLAQSELRDFAQAAISLQQAQRLRASDHKTSIARARALRGSDDLTGAYLEYQSALALRPNATAALRGRDEVLSLLPGPPPEPVGLGAEPGPDDHDLWFKRGNLLLSQGAAAEAARAFQAALASRENADAWHGLGLACTDGTGPEDPIACYNRALEIDPYYYWAHFDLGNARRIAGDHNAALGHYDEAIRCQREYADAWYGKGFPWQRSGGTAKRSSSMTRHYNWSPTSRPSPTTAEIRCANSAMLPPPQATASPRRAVSGRGSPPTRTSSARETTPEPGTAWDSATSNWDATRTPWSISTTPSPQIPTRHGTGMTKDGRCRPADATGTP